MAYVDNAFDSTHVIVGECNSGTFEYIDLHWPLLIKGGTWA